MSTTNLTIQPMPMVSPFSVHKTFLGDGYLYSGYGYAKILLDTIRTKTPYFTSENYRRTPDDVFFTGEFRELAGISVQSYPGIGRVEENYIIEFYNFSLVRILLSNPTVTYSDLLEHFNSRAIPRIFFRRANAVLQHGTYFWHFLLGTF